MSAPDSSITARERMRAARIAVWNKAIELAVLAKLRWQGGEPTEFDRRALAGIHARMMNQLACMRRAVDPAAVANAAHVPVASTVGVHNAKVVLCAPIPGWAAEAAQEAALLKSTLGAHSAVHHIGSTAIERLAAKPVVDLAIALPSAQFDREFSSVRIKLGSLGYQYLGVRGGHFFEKATASVRTHALQVHPAESQILSELLRFRDALRDSDELRADYEATKRTLAVFFPHRRLLYVFYKSHWIDDWQWRHSGVAEWADWILNQKRAQTQLVHGARLRE